MARDGGVGGNETIDAVFLSNLHDFEERIEFEVRGKFDEEGFDLGAPLSCEFDVLGLEGADEVVEVVALLELTKAGGIGTADVNDDIVGEIEEESEA